MDILLRGHSWPCLLLSSFLFEEKKPKLSSLLAMNLLMILEFDHWSPSLWSKCFSFCPELPLWRPITKVAASNISSGKSITNQARYSLRFIGVTRWGCQKSPRVGCWLPRRQRKATQGRLSSWFDKLHLQAWIMQVLTQVDRSSTRRDTLRFLSCIYLQNALANSVSGKPSWALCSSQAIKVTFWDYSSHAGCDNCMCVCVGGGR